MYQIIPNSIDKMLFKSHFVYNVAQVKSKDDWKMHLVPAGKFRGFMDGDSFWVDKISTIPSNIPRRYFYGEMLSSEKSLVIRGRFCFSNTTKLYFALIFFFIFLAVYIPTKHFGVACVIAGIMVICYYGICRLLNIGRERAIINLIKSL